MDKNNSRNSYNIRILPQNLINQISAGEVIDRPSSALKEMIENSIDAGATLIEVNVIDGGKTLICVQDDGCGIAKNDLKFAIYPHATSKIKDDNIFAIQTLGFRGEALASIASIARISITSKFGKEAWKLDFSIENNAQNFNYNSENCNNDNENFKQNSSNFMQDDENFKQNDENCNYNINNVKYDNNNIYQNIKLLPANFKKGTLIEVKDLYFSTPARLKFLKKTSIENENCIDVFKKIAISKPEIHFIYKESGKIKFDYQKAETKSRVNDILQDFIDNSIPITSEYNQISMHGFISKATFHKANANSQYIFINDRFIKDKVLSQTLKNVYYDVMPHGRFPVAVLWIKIGYDEVDVNAHPAKTEVRFKDIQKVKDFFYNSIKNALIKGGMLDYNYIKNANNFINFSQNNDNFSNSNFTLHENNLDTVNTNSLINNNSDNYSNLKDNFRSIEGNFIKVKNNFSKTKNDFSNIKDNFNDIKDDFIKYNCNEFTNNYNEDNLNNKICNLNNDHSAILGNAICQIDCKYIISQRENELFIIDQHAVCERITIEYLKKNEKIDTQFLLIPEVLTMPSLEIESLIEKKEIFNRLGFEIVKSAPDLLMIYSIPTFFKNIDIKILMEIIANELIEFGENFTLNEYVHNIFAKIACHNSIRAGKSLNITEMNYLLKQMESTINIGQCPHGRPSFLQIDTKFLDKLFERT